MEGGEGREAAWSVRKSLQQGRSIDRRMDNGLVSHATKNIGAPSHLQCPANAAVGRWTIVAAGGRTGRARYRLTGWLTEGVEGQER